MISIVDTQAGGTRTRLVLEGGPDLGRGPLSERAARLRRWHDHIRTAVLAEARETPGVTGVLLCEPHAPGCSAGLIAFDAGGIVPLTCAGLIGVTVALARLGQIAPGRRRFDTPGGALCVVLHEDGSVTVSASQPGRADGAYFPVALSQAGFSIHAYRCTERFLSSGQRRELPSAAFHVHTPG